MTDARAWTKRSFCFVVCVLVSILLFRQTLGQIVSLSLQDDRYSHLMLIPVVSLCLLFLERDRIFRRVEFSPGSGSVLLALGIAAYEFSRELRVASPESWLSLASLAVVLVWVALVAFCYGKPSVRAAGFPLLFLFLMVPIPVALMEKGVTTLQHGSADVAYALFKLLGVPVFRQGLQMSLPHVVIEVAEECSGIRSCTGLLITGLIASHVLLQSGWHKLWVVLLTLPIAIFKNGLRIVTISCLGIYFNPGFFHGKLHKFGGLPFSVLGVALLFPLVVALRKSEARSKSPKAIPDSKARVQSVDIPAGIPWRGTR